MNYIKLKIFQLSKNTILEKKKATEWAKIFIIHVTKK